MIRTLRSPSNFNSCPPLKLLRYLLVLQLFCSTVFPACAQKSLRLFKKGKYDQAEQLSLQKLKEQAAEDEKNNFKSLKSNPLIKRITPYYTLGLIYKSRGNFTKSIQNFKKADSVYALFEIAMKARMYNAKGSPKLLSILTGAERTEKNQARHHYTRQVEKVRIRMIVGEMNEAKEELDYLYL